MRSAGTVTIHFEDHGQDFLEWDVQKDGQVVDSRPFQAGVWCKAKVLNVDDLAEGVHVKIRVPSVDRDLTIEYPIVRVEGGSDV